MITRGQSWMVVIYNMRHLHFSLLVMVHIVPVFPFLFFVGVFSWKLVFPPASTRWSCQQLWWVSAGPGPSSHALSFDSLSSAAPVSDTPLLPPTGKTVQCNSYISKRPINMVQRLKYIISHCYKTLPSVTKYNYASICMLQFIEMATYRLNIQSLTWVCNQKKTSNLFRCAIKKLF